VGVGRWHAWANKISSLGRKKGEKKKTREIGDDKQAWLGGRITTFKGGSGNLLVGGGACINYEKCKIMC